MCTNGGGAEKRSAESIDLGSTDEDEPATPSTVGKELANVAYRLRRPLAAVRASPKIAASPSTPKIGASPSKAVLEIQRLAAAREEMGGEGTHAGALCALLYIYHCLLPLVCIYIYI